MEHLMAMDTKPVVSEPRIRITVDVAPEVALLLDYISATTGSPRTHIVLQPLLDALPAMLDRADSIKKRSAQLTQQKPARR